ncbi:hypothetical protein TRFO_21408 [Tritrichomonas foetus]|uniref:Uncharacterized protein n=1 Tax=Tritrichomonas foetus TaxID=1144522 RepID=A0A1J4KJT4_9EUKA|nr:hypothetical protein TRFO_21408 [Tritrichomonas foetus]|eukprot:OHT09613.1 hypothetical protein TRFO_21408 [Tritrichomonas foetus]
MSENQAQNFYSPSKLIPPKSNRPVHDNSPITPKQMEATIAKHKQIIAKYKESQEALLAYREKTLQSIEKYKQNLEQEKEKTDNLMKTIEQKNEASLNLVAEENKRKLQELSQMPLINVEVLRIIKNILPKLREQLNTIREAFVHNNKQFMDDFYSVKSSVRRINFVVAHQDSKTRVSDVKNYIGFLQKAIEEKFKRINKAVNCVNYQRPTQLTLSSSSVSYDKIITPPKQMISIDVQSDSPPQTQDEIIQTRRTERSSRINEFLIKFCAENAEWLNK